MRPSSRGHGRRRAALASVLGLALAAGCGAHVAAHRAVSAESGSGGSVVAGAAAAPSPTQTPPPVPHTAARTLRSVSFQGANRTFLYVTPKPGVPRPLPLLIVLHGRHADASFEEGRTGFDKVAAAGQAIVVYPNATGKDHSWNAGGCCDTSAGTVDDVGFIDAVVQQVRSIAAVDPRRIYVTGYSTGAMMAYRYACARPSTVAALAEVGGVPMVSGCPASSGPAVSLLAIHGTKDHSVPYDGTARSKVLLVATPPIPPVIDRWRARNGCSTSADTHTSGRIVSSYWAGCRDRTVVQFITLEQFDHDWPHRATVGLEATDSIWHFLRARSR